MQLINEQCWLRLHVSKTFPKTIESYHDYKISEIPSFFKMISEYIFIFSDISKGYGWTQWMSRDNGGTGGDDERLRFLRDE